MDRIAKGNELSYEAIQEQALDWFTRSCLGELSSEQEQERDQWRAQHPEHEQAYQALASTWKLADALPKTAMHHWLRHNQQPLQGFLHLLLLHALTLPAQQLPHRHR